MQLTWAKIGQKSQKRLKTVGLVAAGMAAIYFGTIRPYEGMGIAAKKVSGSTARGWEPGSTDREAWDEKIVVPTESRSIAGVALISGGTEFSQLPAASPYVSEHQKQPSDTDRKMVRIAALDIVVKNPEDISEKIRRLAEQLGGFLVKSATKGGADAGLASLSGFLPIDSKKCVPTSASWDYESRGSE